MIDKITYCVELDASNKIEDLDEWFDKCPPQGKKRQWQDRRSAKETAKHWLHSIPQPFQDILKPHKLKYKLCSPEYVSSFDAYKGNGRNHDLLLIAQSVDSKPVIVSIESKADEPFGVTIAKKMIDAKKKKQENQNSKALERIKELREALFGEEHENQLNLRYQLLTAVAGTIAEAKKQGAKSAFFLIQTFIEKVNDKHLQNNKDLDRFLTAFTKSRHTKIENAEVLGPFRIAKSNDLLSNKIDLWIGKYEIEI